CVAQDLGRLPSADIGAREHVVHAESHTPKSAGRAPKALGAVSRQRTLGIVGPPVGVAGLCNRVPDEVDVHHSLSPSADGGRFCPVTFASARQLLPETFAYAFGTCGRKSTMLRR